MKITPWGEWLRKYRMEAPGYLVLYHMATAVGMGSAEFCAIEVGRKPIPEGLTERIRDIYKLTDEQFAELKAAEAETRKMREEHPEVWREETLLEQTAPDRYTTERYLDQMRGIGVRCDEAIKAINAGEYYKAVAMLKDAKLQSEYCTVKTVFLAYDEEEPGEYLITLMNGNGADVKTFICHGLNQYDWREQERIDKEADE